jgi:predicted metal-dependent hydrolase
MSIIVRSDGTVTITLPHGCGNSHAEAFFSTKKEWVRRAIRKMEQRKNLPHTIPQASKEDFAAWKERARTLVGERLRHFNALYGLAWNRITIKNTSTRWGSCSKRKNLNFNYRIVFLPPTLADYLVVHELCHLAALDHSDNFWNLVGKAIPDYKACRKLLRVM